MSKLSFLEGNDTSRTYVNEKEVHEISRVIEEELELPELKESRSDFNFKEVLSPSSGTAESDKKWNDE